MSLSDLMILILILIMIMILILIVWGGRRVVGTIWNIGAGDPSSRPIRNANSGISLKVD